MIEDAVSALAEKLSWSMESWASIELHVRIDVENSNSSRGKSLEAYIETALGQRLYDRTMSPVADPNDTNRWVNYADGQRFAEVTWAGLRQVRILYTKGFDIEQYTARTWQPTPLTYLYLHQRPLFEALAEARQLGQERRLGRDCEVLVFRGVKWTFTPVDMVYSLDRETAMPLSVRCYDAGADRVRDQPQWYWEAKSFDRVDGGRYWPMRSAEYEFGPAADGKKELLASRDIHVESIQFNKEYPEAIFRPVLEPGTHVLDTTTDNSWVVPGQNAVQPQGSTSTPLRATRPPDWTSPISLASLVFGSALLVVAAASWWRRRS